MTTFQSTLPVGGATALTASWSGFWKHFNPRSPWGERRALRRAGQTHCNFNPRSPWGERPGLAIIIPREKYFNPRSPWGERRGLHCRSLRRQKISIHAPRGGSDGKDAQIFRPSLARVNKFLSRKQEGTCFSWCGRAKTGRALRNHSVRTYLENTVCLGFAVKSSGCLPVGRCSCSRNAPPSFRTGFPDNRTAGCPSPGP